MGSESPQALRCAARRGALHVHTKYFRVSEKVYRLNRQVGFMTVEERLRLAQIEAERLRKALEKAKVAKRKAAADRPAFPGAHRGY
jgi:hypothetical protein